MKKITNMKTAIIIIDMQKGFINKKNKSLSKKIKNHIKKNKYDFILFSNFINKKSSNFFKILKFKKMIKKQDIEIDSELKNLAKKQTNFKRKTYSVFKDKKLMKFIKKNKIKKLYLCGLESDACILASGFEAFDLNIDFKILKSLTKSINKKLDLYANQIIDRNLK